VPAPVASLAQAFLDAGSAAVLGMQGDIAGDQAVAFSKAFYKALIKDGEHALDAAVLSARRAMSAARLNANVVDDADWSYPVLTLRALPHQVLPSPPGPSDTTLALRFVARVAQRWQVHKAIRCPSAGAAGRTSRNMVVIVGEGKSGKSHLAKWSAQACRRAGLTAELVPFGSSEGSSQPVDWLDAIRWIRDGQRREKGKPPQPRADWRLAEAHFREFNWGLNHRQQGLTQFAPLTDPGPVVDRGLGLTDAIGIPENFFEDTMTQFRDALASCARANGLVLVLDQLDGIEPMALTRFLPNGLFKQVAAGGVDGVRLILVLTRKQFADCRHELERMTHVPEVVDLEYFRDADFDRIARHLCHQWSEMSYDTMSPVLPTLLTKHSKNGVWNVEALQDVDQMCGVLWPPRGG
jgi:hypothetical protein